VCVCVRLSIKRSINIARIPRASLINSGNRMSIVIEREGEERKRDHSGRKKLRERRGDDSAEWIEIARGARRTKDSKDS